MKIVLLKEVQGLGHIGEIKEVKEGYARNFLIPKNLAQAANKHTLKVINDQNEKQKRQKTKTAQKKQALAKKINNKTFLIKADADEKGTLYAGIDAKKISSELNKQGVAVEESEILLNESIKNTGEHKVKLDINGEKVSINLNIR